MPSESGTITHWNDKKGFGFITPKEGGQQLFIHIHEFSKAHNRPIQRLAVTYEKGKDIRGRSCAIQVVPVHGHKQQTGARRQLVFSILFAGAFLAFVGLLVTMKLIPFAIFAAYIVLSAFAYLVYKRDKSAAEWDEWRTRESTLHWISLIGGWPGALIAQNNLRHKSSKLSFRVVYWLTVVVNCSVLTWLITPDGVSTTQRLLNSFH